MYPNLIRQCDFQNKWEGQTARAQCVYAFTSKSRYPDELSLTVVGQTTCPTPNYTKYLDTI